MSLWITSIIDKQCLWVVQQSICIKRDVHYEVVDKAWSANACDRETTGNVVVFIFYLYVIIKSNISCS